MRIGTVLAAVAAAGAFALGPAAHAEVKRAESILPPGQSGFISAAGLTSGTGSPHLYDQQQPFIDFRWKPATFFQPGATVEPRAGVRITRDAFGVPSVVAGTESDAWWGAGYAIAQDRLFQLELFRAATQGRLSEIVGRGRLDSDRIVRQDLYTPGELDAMFDRLAPRLQARFAAYRDGINAWVAHLATSPLDIPAEFAATTTPVRGWTIRDSVAIGVFLARTIPTNADPEGLELANMRALQLSGRRALDALVPLRTPGSLPTVPREQRRRFPSQPGRTRRDERAGLERSARFVRDLAFPDPAPSGAIAAPARAATRTRSRIDLDFTPRLGGSYMFALRRPSDGHAFLFNGPQLGFDAPEKLVELEVHAPGLDVRGLTAPGIPVIGAGFNRELAWGITTGASDTDDLYAEELVPGRPELYHHRGQVRRMDCRNEVLRYESPPSDLLSLKPLESGRRTVRLCRTVHGPVEARAGNVAYARRYAAWGRELETLEGLAALSTARDIGDADRATRRMTWNENIMAIDSRGNMGFWHPGLFPLRPRRWDERLPYPGTGEAEWRGLLPRSRTPSVINPRQGWLANWNNLPSEDWTAGDGTARKRMDGKFFRVGRLMRLVRGAARAPSFEAMQDVVRRAGTVAQQAPLARSRVRRAARGASGPARRVLDTLLAWDGDYHRTDGAGTVDPGVATWTAFRAEAAKSALAPLGPGARLLRHETDLDPLYGAYVHAAPYHLMEATHPESYALRTLSPAGYRAAAAAAAERLRERFGTDDPARWREPRRMYDIALSGAAAPPPLPFFDRGTFEQFVELGP